MFLFGVYLFQVMIIQDYPKFVVNQLKFTNQGQIIEDYDMQVSWSGLQEF